jgi:hypothetical protein
MHGKLFPLILLLLVSFSLSGVFSANIATQKDADKLGDKATSETIEVSDSETGAKRIVPAPPKGFEFSWTKASPKGDMMIAEYICRGEMEYAREIWLSLASDPLQKELLFKHNRYAQVIMSPDEKWIVLNNDFASNVSDPLLCKRGKGLKFDLVGKPGEIGMKIWTFFEKSNNVKAPLDYGHQYVDAVLWGSNSRTVLFCAKGHEDESHYLNPWFCVFNVETDKLSLDLRELDKGSLVDPTRKHKPAMNMKTR